MNIECKITKDLKYLILILFGCMYCLEVIINHTYNTKKMCRVWGWWITVTIYPFFWILWNIWVILKLALLCKLLTFSLPLIYTCKKQFFHTCQTHGCDVLVSFECEQNFKDNLLVSHCKLDQPVCHSAVLYRALTESNTCEAASISSIFAC